MYQPEKTSYCAAAADQPDLVDKRPQVDVNAAANGHSRTVDNTSQLDTNNDGGLGHPAVVDVSSDSSHASSPDVEAAAERCHIAVDIDGLDEGGAGCVVCMEPLEWVAVGPCGHRVACSRCAARIRTGPGADKRCCICRRLCPTVVVARAAAGNGVFDFSKMPAATHDGQVGEYWYYASMSAYFDDKKHYEVTKQVAQNRFLEKRRPPPRPLPPRPDDVTGRDLDATPHRHRLCVVVGHVVKLLIVVAVCALVFGSLGYLITRGEQSERIANASGMAACTGLTALFIYCLQFLPAG